MGLKYCKFPAGARFGAAHNAECMVPTATMLDFYNGGGIDVTCLGAAEVCTIALHLRMFPCST